MSLSEQQRLKKQEWKKTMNKNKYTCNEDASLALANYRKGNFLILLATAVVILLSAKSLRAQTNAYWDVNGTTTGQGGTGTWSTSGTNWTTNSGCNPNELGKLHFQLRRYGWDGNSGGCFPRLGRKLFNVGLHLEY
ncbi:hypothetical protein EBX31_05970 [bacterium]|nr:hypothetical protein [bacterium]